MKRKSRRALMLVAAVFLLALTFLFLPNYVKLGLIDTEQPLIGDFTTGDFLTLFSIFSGSITIGLFVLIFLEKK